MTAERWAVIEELFNSAADLSEDERDGFLSKSCVTDPKLRQEVEILLKFGSAPKSILDTVAITVMAKAMAANEYPSPPLVEGQELSHYRILKAIGQGGMGVVYEAEDLKLRRRVALKLLPQSMAANLHALRRFEREAQAASALNHPNICTVYEIGEHEGLHFIAIELLDGETLKQRIARGTVETRMIVEIAIQICDALEVAHSASIVHRDVKPSNIVLTSRGIAKLLDFGVAKRSAPGEPPSGEDLLELLPENLDLRLTNPGSTVGTVAYMSPEQAAGSEVDARSDLFSLGVVIYEMATGRLPYSGENVAQVLAAIKDKKPVPIEQLSSKAPAELVRITRKALQKDRSERYQHAGEMGAELKALRPRLDAKPARKRVWLMVATAVFIVGMAIFFVVRNGRIQQLLAKQAAEPQEIKSLAVLPLENLTGDTSQDYFVDGMTDALITNLTKLGSLRVISRTSAMHYKGTQKTIPEIARELNVNAVLAGSVGRSGKRVRISAQLAEAGTGQNLWGHDYEQDLQDVLQLQSEIATAVATEITGKLVPQQKRNGARSVNPEAYEAYLRGLHFSEHGDFDKSLDYFQEAIRIDPNYAPAYSGLADSYVAVGVGTEADSNKSYQSAILAARKAISLDDSSAEAHESLAFVLHRLKHDWRGAEREFKRALELNPNYALAQMRYGVYLLTIGRPKAGCEQMRLAYSLDPVSPRTMGWFAGCLYDSGHFDEALKIMNLAIEMNPKDEAGLRGGIGELYEQNKMYPEAVAEYQKSIDLGGRGWFALALLASGYASWGKDAEAEKVLAEMRQKFGDDSYINASTHAVMGKKEQAIRELAGDGRCPVDDDANPGWTWLRINWRFDSIRSDPRFKALERCAHYPDPE
jgi:serine/threonine protein kinase/Tfp pilus assembly protein PilF